jgi:small conductance mechanosensitive channel
MPIHQWHNFKEVFEQWRSDALEFLRQDAPKILVVLIIAFVLLWILRLFTHRLRALSKRQAFPTGIRSQQLATLAGVIKTGGIFLIVFSALIQILGVLSIDVKPLIASAGVVGLAIGFGAQALVKDVINGFFILIENQYDVGDAVKVAGVQGTVENMTLRRTVLRDADGTVHTVPNGQIAIVSNLTRDWTQVSLHVSVAYTEDSDKVVRVLREVASEVWNSADTHELLVSEPEVPGIDGINGSVIDYLVLVKTRPGKQFPVTRELRRRIKQCFERNNIQPGDATKTLVITTNPLPGKPA